MTDLSTLTDTELNERISALMPNCWTCGNSGIRSVWGDECDDCRKPFTTSLDALKSGPEKMLREAGWRLEVCQQAEHRYEASWWNHGWITAVAPTEERARAEAVCQGLRVMEEQR